MQGQTAEPFVHPALFYRGEGEYLAGTVPFVRGGLAAHEPVAVAVPAGRLELLRRSLGADAERVALIDMERAGRNPGRIIAGVLRSFADAHPSGRVRIIGEPIWPGRSETEYPACVQHEALINAAFRGRAVTIVCPYDVAALTPEVIADAWATHPVVFDGGRERHSARYAPDRVVAAYNQPLEHPPGAATFDFDASSLPTARNFAVRYAGRFGLDRTLLDDVALIVAELTTNSVLHGGGTGRVLLWPEAGQLVGEVRDGGRLTDPLAGRRPPVRGRPGGRGLILVHNLASLVRVHTGPCGTTVRFYLAG